MLTIIIPAYNAAGTIERAISSVKENEPDAEILVIENGSTDHTSEKVSNINGIRLLHSEKGVSRARNLGIKEASGEWIAFLDADDIWLGVEDQELKADITVFNYYKGEKLIKLDYSNEDPLVWMLRKPTQRMTVWAKIYKASFLRENELFFDENLWISEDSEFLIRAVKNHATVDSCDEPLYRYMNDIPSVMRSFNEKRTMAYLETLKKAKESISDDNSTELGAFNDYVYAHINLIGVHNIYNCAVNEKWTVRNQRMKNVISDGVVQIALNKLGFKDILNIQRLPGLLFKLRAFSLGGSICYIRSRQNIRKTKGH